MNKKLRSRYNSLLDKAQDRVLSPQEGRELKVLGEISIMDKKPYRFELDEQYIKHNLR